MQVDEHDPSQLQLLGQDYNIKRKLSFSGNGKAEPHKTVSYQHYIKYSLAGMVIH